MVRASVSGAVDLGLIPSLVKPMTVKLVFTASLLDAISIKRTVRVQIKPASLLVVPSVKALSGIPPSCRVVDRDGWQL